MAVCQAPKTLQCRGGRLEMVPNDAQDGQADGLYLQHCQSLYMRCRTAEAIDFMTQQQTKTVKGCQRDPETSRKIPQHSAPLRLRHECWPRRIPRNLSGADRGASRAACARHTFAPAIVVDLDCAEPEA